MEVLCGAFRASAGAIVAPESTLKVARENLKLLLETAKVPERKDSSRFGRKDNIGFYEMTPKGRKYTIHATPFQKCFETDDHLAMALDSLKKKRLPTPKKTQVPVADAAGKEWAVTTPKWPDGISTRSIVFLDPFARGSKAKAGNS